MSETLPAALAELSQGGLAAPVDGVGFAVDAATRVAEIRLDSPPGNRFAMARIRRILAIVEALADCRPDDPVRALVWTAAGKDFSHGADLTDPELVGAITTGETAQRKVAAQGQRLVETLDGLHMPTLIAAQGRIIGAGACVFCACDFRLAGPGASLCFPEVDRGMHLSWGILPIMVRELGTPTARRLSITGEALPVADLPPGSLFVESTDCQDDARGLAVILAAKPPLAVRQILEVLRASATDGVAAAAADPQRFADTVSSADFGEAMAAWLNKRPPDFRGR